MKQAIAYIRVSTQKQGKSGLGLEAQDALIRRFADQEGLQTRDVYGAAGKEWGVSHDWRRIHRRRSAVAIAEDLVRTTARTAPMSCPSR